MSSDGEFDEGEYSEESQGPEYAEEVAEELADLVDDPDSSSDYDPDQEEEEGEEEEEESEEEDTEKPPVKDWDRALVDSIDPLFLELVKAQPVPPVETVKARFQCIRGLAAQRINDAQARKHFLRLVASCDDFYDHISEEFSDHLTECMRIMKKLDSRMKRNP